MFSFSFSRILTSMRSCRYLPSFGLFVVGLLATGLISSCSTSPSVEEIRAADEARVKEEAYGYNFFRPIPLRVEHMKAMNLKWIIAHQPYYKRVDTLNHVPYLLYFLAPQDTGLHDEIWSVQARIPLKNLHDVDRVEGFLKTHQCHPAPGYRVCSVDPDSTLEELNEPYFLFENPNLLLLSRKTKVQKRERHINSHLSGW